MEFRPFIRWALGGVLVAAMAPYKGLAQQSTPSLEDLFTPSQPAKTAQTPAERNRVAQEKSNAKQQMAVAMNDQDADAQPELVLIQKFAAAAVYRTGIKAKDALAFDVTDLVTLRQMVTLTATTDKLCEENPVDICKADEIVADYPELSSKAQRVLDDASDRPEDQIEAVAKLEVPARNLVTQKARTAITEIFENSNEAYNTTLTDGQVSLPATLAIIKALQSLEEYQFLNQQFRHANLESLTLLEPEIKNKTAPTEITDDALPAVSLPEMAELQRLAQAALSRTADKAITALRSTRVEDMDSDQALNLNSLHKSLCIQSVRGACTNFLLNGRRQAKKIRDAMEEPDDMKPDEIIRAPVEETKSVIQWLKDIVSEMRDEDTEPFLNMEKQGKVSLGLTVRMVSHMERLTRFTNSVMEILHPAPPAEAPADPGQVQSPTAAENPLQTKLQNALGSYQPLAANISLNS